MLGTPFASSAEAGHSTPLVSGKQTTNSRSLWNIFQSPLLHTDTENTNWKLMHKLGQKWSILTEKHPYEPIGSFWQRITVINDHNKLLNSIVKVTRTSDVLPDKLLDRDETRESWERIRWQEAGDRYPKSVCSRTEEPQERRWPRHPFREETRGSVQRVMQREGLAGTQHRRFLLLASGGRCCGAVKSQTSQPRKAHQHTSTGESRRSSLKASAFITLCRGNPHGF